MPARSLVARLENECVELGADPARDDVVDSSLTVNAGDSHVRGIRTIRSREMTLEGAGDRGRDTRRASHVDRSEAGLPEDEVSDRLLRRARSDRARTASRQQREEAHDGRTNSSHARHYAQPAVGHWADALPGRAIVRFALIFSVPRQ
jgi:hypothetical protein